MNIKVHIGAHKTATTHFQDNLKNFILNGQFNEINYIHRDAIRKGKYVTRLMDEPNIYRSLKLRLGLAEPAPWSEAALLCNSNVELCLISEENIMGKPKDILEGFYLKAASRV